MIEFISTESHVCYFNIWPFESKSFKKGSAEVHLGRYTVHITLESQPSLITRSFLSVYPSISQSQDIKNACDWLICNKIRREISSTLRPAASSSLSEGWPEGILLLGEGALDRRCLRNFQAAFPFACLSVPFGGATELQALCL